jgi:hypothetical protein
MTNQHDGPLCASDNEARSGHIVSQRRRWVLNDADVVAVLLENVVDALPTGAVNKAAVYEDDADR